MNDHHDVVLVRCFCFLMVAGRVNQNITDPYGHTLHLSKFMAILIAECLHCWVSLRPRKLPTFTEA